MLRQSRPYTLVIPSTLRPHSHDSEAWAVPLCRHCMMQLKCQGGTDRLFLAAPKPRLRVQKTTSGFEKVKDIRLDVYRAPTPSSKRSIDSCHMRDSGTFKAAAWRRKPSVLHSIGGSRDLLRTFNGYRSFRTFQFIVVSRKTASVCSAKCIARPNEYQNR
jgi:hypothetical protein